MDTYRKATIWIWAPFIVFRNVFFVNLITSLRRFFNNVIFAYSALVPRVSMSKASFCMAVFADYEWPYEVLQST